MDSLLNGLLQRSTEGNIVVWHLDPPGCVKDMPAFFTQGGDLFCRRSAFSSFGNDGENIARLGEIQKREKIHTDFWKTHSIERIHYTNIGIVWSNDFLAG